MLRRDGRVVDYNGLENRRAERHRGFESLSLRNQAWKIKCLQTKYPKKYPKTAFSGFFLPSSPPC